MDSLDRDRDDHAQVVAGFVDVDRSDLDGGLAFLQTGHDAVFEGCDRRIIHFHRVLVGLAQFHLDLQFGGSAFVDLDAFGADLQGQVGGRSVLIQADSGPHVRSEVTGHADAGGIVDIDGVQVSIVAFAAVVRQVQEFVLEVVDHGGPDGVGHVSDAGQVKAGGAEVGPRHGTFMVHDEGVELAAFGDAVEETAVFVVVFAVVIFSAASRREGGHVIFPKERVAQVEVDQAAGFGIDHGQVSTAVARADDGAYVVAHFGECIAEVLRQRVAVGQDPVGDDAAQLGHFIGVRVDRKHGVVGGAVQDVVHAGSPAQLADFGQSFPVGRVIGAEHGGHALAVLVPDDAAEFGYRRFGDGDRHFSRQVRLGIRGDRDNGLADRNAGHGTLLTHGRDSGIRGFEGYVGVGQRPGSDRSDQVGRLALQQVQFGRFDRDVDSGIGGLDHVSAAGHDEQAVHGAVQTAGRVIGTAAGAEVHVGSGRRTVLRADLPQIVVVVLAAVVVGGQIQGIRVVVEGQRAGVAVVVYSHGADQRRLDLGHFRGFGFGFFAGRLFTLHFEVVDVQIVLVKRVEVTDGQVDLFLSQILSQVEGVLRPVRDRFGLGDDFRHGLDVGRGADVRGEVFLPGRRRAAGIEGQLRRGGVGQIDRRSDGPVIGARGVPLGLQHAGAVVVAGAGVVVEVGAVTVSIDQRPVVEFVSGLEIPAGKHAFRQFGLFFFLFGFRQRQLEQFAVRVRAAVGADVDHAVIVDRHRVGFGVAAGHAGQSQGRRRRQGAGQQIDLIDRVVIAQSVQGLVLVVIRHVIDRIHDTAVLADALRFAQGIQRSGIQPAVRAGHEDVAVHVFSGAHADAHLRVNAEAAEGAFAVVVPQVLGVDLPGAVAGAGFRGGGGGDEADHGSAVVDGLAAQLDLERGFVAGIVSDQQGQLARHVQAFQQHRDFQGLSLFGLFRNGLVVDLGTGAVHDGYVSNVVVILSADIDVAGDRIHQGGGDGRGFGIHGHGVLDGSAVFDQAGFQQFGELVDRQGRRGRRIAFVLGRLDGVVFRNAVVTDGHFFAGFQTQTAQGLVDVGLAGAVVLPGTAVDVVVRRVGLSADGAGIQDLAFLVLDREELRTQVTDVDVGEGSDGVFRIDGFTAFGIFILDGVRVDHVGLGGAVGLLQGHEVDVLVGQVRQLAGAVSIVYHGGAVEHGRAAPGTVQAKDRDGLFHIQELAFFIGGGLDVGVAFHEEVAAEVVSQERGIIFVELDVHGDVGRLGDLDGRRGSRFEDQAGVDGGDGLVAVHIGRIRVERIFFIGPAGDVIQDRLGIGFVGHAVLVDVRIQGGSVLIGLAVDLVGHVGADQDGAVILQHAVTGVAGQPLREDVGAQLEFLGFAHRIDGETEAVFAVALRIVAQLSLDFAVSGGIREHGRIFIHQDVGGGLDGLADVG